MFFTTAFANNEPITKKRHVGDPVYVVLNKEGTIKNPIIIPAHKRTWSFGAPIEETTTDMADFTEKFDIAGNKIAEAQLIGVGQYEWIKWNPNTDRQMTRKDADRNDVEAQRANVDQYGRVNTERPTELKPVPVEFTATELAEADKKLNDHIDLLIKEKEIEQAKVELQGTRIALEDAIVAVQKKASEASKEQIELYTKAADLVITMKQKEFDGKTATFERDQNKTVEDLIKEEQDQGYKPVWDRWSPVLKYVNGKVYQDEKADMQREINMLKKIRDAIKESSKGRTTSWTA